MSDTPRTDAAVEFITKQLREQPTICSDHPYYVLDMMKHEGRKVERELTRLQNLVQQYHGIDRPFICGHVEGSEPGTLPEEIVVCPAMGSDEVAVYRRVTPVSSPKY